MTDRFAFRKSWGAELLENRAARFRLWAPGQTRVAVRVGNDDRRADLDRADDGWFEGELNDLAPGTAYSFLVGDGLAVPDPAARAQMHDVHGASRLVDPLAHQWRTAAWPGRPWEEAVIYELHVGTFDPAGDFDGVRRRLDHLARIGITAVELMPVAQFAGRRGWGYDGVLPYCPHAAYGGPEGLKRLVDAAHERDLMVMLDVVYNHFGPDGNYLHAYAKEFFDHERQTPWGDAIRFSARPVRAFFIENALYWLQEYRLDGLRLDAIDQILDASERSVLEELAERVRTEVRDRPVHLTTEDERNIVSLHPRDPDGHPILYTAEWNDDIHHAAHTLATGESEGYYRDFASDAIGCLLRGLSEGFIFQGEPYSPWSNQARGVRSASQPPAAFVDFLQNHDQVGNRAFGERLSILSDPRTVDLLTAVLLLNPQTPLLFMGEEYGEVRPFLFFTDFTGDLAAAVREGRRREFKDFAAFVDAGDRESIPDPNDLTTFEACRLDWSRAESPQGQARLDLVKRLLSVRRAEIAPRLLATTAMRATARRTGDRAFDIAWHLGDVTFRMVANFAEAEATVETLAPSAKVIFESDAGAGAALGEGRIGARSLVAVRQGR